MSCLSEIEGFSKLKSFLFHFRATAPCGSENLIRWAGSDATEAFISASHSPSVQTLMQNFCVGVLEPCDSSLEQASSNNKAESVENLGVSTAAAAAFDSVRDLLFDLSALVGCNCRKLVHSLPLQQPEIDCSRWLTAAFLKGGLQEVPAPDPYNEEKGEVRSNSCPASAATSPQCDAPPVAPEEPPESGILLSDNERFRLFLTQLAESRGDREDVLTRHFRSLATQHLIGPLNLDADHPLEEVGWTLLAVLLYHHGAGILFRETQFSTTSTSLPTGLHPLFRAVQQCKWRLFQQRQKLDQSHKEVCSPVIEKCR